MIDNPKIRVALGLIFGLAFVILSGIAMFYFSGQEPPKWLALAQWVIGQVGIMLGLNVGAPKAPAVPK